MASAIEGGMEHNEPTVLTGLKSASIWGRRARVARFAPLRDGLSTSDREVWPTPDGLPSYDLTDPDESRVAILGDWESQEWLVFPFLRRLQRLAPDVRTILHVGDLRWSAPVGSTKGGGRGPRPFTWKLDEELQERGIRRLILVPGNHEWWERLVWEFADHPDRFFRVGQRIWIAPRGFRFKLAGHTYLCMGGAVSLERDGGPFEAPTDEEINSAIDGGRVDVLLTHEAIDADIAEVQQLIRASGTFSLSRRASSAESRGRLTRLWSAVHPQQTFHGHMHVAGSSRQIGGGEVHSLNVIRGRRHAALLTLTDLSVRWLEDL
ncbi:metallophosphoesterase family protein [Curtobacterium flaccumfaciens pv. flaccumfaciens]|uniref:metallophosphoesterase family protein n=1 Tax=Curtobacterium flaccumfaciens TaxID=2035 RepID=UPI003AB90D58